MSDLPTGERYEDFFFGGLILIGGLLRSRIS